MKLRLIAGMTRRVREGLSQCACNLAVTGVRDGTCSRCVVCLTPGARTSTAHMRSFAGTCSYH